MSKDILLAAAFVLVTVGGWLVIRAWLVWRAMRRGRLVHQKGQKREVAAERLLTELGYLILERQPMLTARMRVNGELRHFSCTPDFLVEMEGKRFVVEVKGSAGEDPVSSADTRRQVLEYLMASGLACLLVNPIREEVDFIALS